MAFLFKLETEAGTPAEPHAAVPNGEPKGKQDG